MHQTINGVDIELTPEQEAALVSTWAANAAPRVPAEVDMWQARRTLLDAGHLTSVSNYLAGMTGDAGDRARIDWEFKPKVRRDSSLVAEVAKAIGLTDAQIDALFIQAGEL